jgi:hypothetical protein
MPFEIVNARMEPEAGAPRTSNIFDAINKVKSFISLQIFFMPSKRATCTIPLGVAMIGLSMPI